MPAAAEAYAVVYFLFVKSFAAEKKCVASEDE